MQRKLLILGLFCIGIVLVSVVAVVVPLLLRHEERITEPEQNQQQDDEFPTLGRFVERPVDELLLEFDDYGPGMTVATSAHGDYIAVGAPFYNHRINGTTDGTNQTITTIRAAGMVRVFYTTRVDNQTKPLPVGQALIGSSRSTYKGSALALSDTAERLLVSEGTGYDSKSIRVYPKTTSHREHDASWLPLGPPPCI